MKLGLSQVKECATFDMQYYDALHTLHLMYYKASFHYLPPFMRKEPENQLAIKNKGDLGVMGIESATVSKCFVSPVCTDKRVKAGKNAGQLG